MALLFADGFDVYANTNVLQKWDVGLKYSVADGNIAMGTPGRLGYGQYIDMGGPSGGSGDGYIGKALVGGPYTTLICGAAYFYNGASVAVVPTSVFGFYDNFAVGLCAVVLSPTGQIGLNVGGVYHFSSPGVVQLQTWTYIEAEILFSNAATGSVTLRVNGVTVLTVGTIVTATNGNGCSMFAIMNDLGGAGGFNSVFFDDLYVLDTTSPNNTFFGDVKIVPLMPAGNGRVNGWSRFGGSGSGNYTAVNEIPPDGDSSYVYTAVPGTEDCYTLQTLSNVATIKAVQLSAFVRKDDTPSRVVSLGVGNGSTEDFDSGTSVNTTYTYILRELDENPLTSAAWSPSDFTTLQSCIELIS